MNQAQETEKKAKKIITGFVVSNKMQKTVVIRVEHLQKHPVVKKIIKRSKKFHADDPKNECNEGDKVQIIECRPLSKKKRYRLLKIMEKAK
jgi:small subunit ribosomal protein S17